MPASASRSRVADREVLHAAVRMMHQPVEGPFARPQRLLQGGEHEVGVQRARDVPADDVAREDVDDEGGVGEAGPGADVGDVGDPEPVGGGGVEVALHQVQRPRCRLVRDGRAHLRGRAGRLSGPGRASAAPRCSGRPACLRAAADARACGRRRRRSAGPWTCLSFGFRASSR